ncbi:hypothetical protein DL769_008296 [Monosporascus sp. CRB-8-3]|nr:hypothetical protein DL769_008296 [Monosporascus sp. CRB-8-3]
MTDDSNPIELSWEWDGAAKPTIRFSVEPVDTDAGNACNPTNSRAAMTFKNRMSKAIPDSDMLWFEHFDRIFNHETSKASCLSPRSPEGHSPRIFWAFDFGEEGLKSKAYFFPGYTAEMMGKSNLEVISEAISTAPFSSAENLEAYRMITRFQGKLAKATLEIDMLAIDLVDPMQSRLKLYFRNRETSFRSVREMMTLGGQISNIGLEKGLCELKQLWSDLFGQGEVEETPLPYNNHRTAGILYNVEFRLGNKEPNVKIYIPVRHYARNDLQIMRTVSKFAGGGSMPRKGNKPTGGAYVKAIDTVL